MRQLYVKPSGMADDPVLNLSIADVQKVAADDGYAAIYSILSFCNFFVMPIMIIVGIIGNVLTFIVFIWSPLKRSSASVFMAALAFADCGFLVCLGASWLDIFQFSFFQQQAVCTSIVYATYTFSFLSVWFFVCFTTDMYLVMFHERLASRVNQPRKARLIVCLFTVASGVLYLHTFWTTKQVTTVQGHITCSFVADDRLRIGLTLADSFLTLLLPFFIIIFMNFRIFLVIAGFARDRRLSALPFDHLTADDDGSPPHDTRLNMNTTSHSDPKADSLSATKSTRDVFVNRSEATTGNEVSNRDVNMSELEFDSFDPRCEEFVPPLGLSQEAKAKHTLISEIQRKSFKMLLTVATVFLLLYLPSHAIRLQGLLRSVFDPSYVTSEVEHLCQQFFQFLYYLNFTANFVIYNACAKSFRAAFFRLPLVFSRACVRCQTSRKRKKARSSGRIGQELRRRREEQNSRLVEVNLAELRVSNMESFAPDFKYQSPPCLLKLSE